jgi:hypothetical protein
VLCEDKLRIDPYESCEREMIFILKLLKSKLGDVIVGGIPTIKRALVGEKEVKGRKMY